MLIILIVTVWAKPPDTLYTADDYVEILDHSNFYVALHDETKFWIVEFYASWCGHCQHLAPVVKKWSSDVKNWGRLVSMGVINCGQSSNSKICGENGIKGYPTIRYYPRGERNYKAVNEIRGLSEETLVEETMNVIKKDIPESCPLSFDNLATVADINDVNRKDLPLILVIGDKENIVESETLVAEFSTFDGVYVGHSLPDKCDTSNTCENKKSVCCEYNVDHTPKVVLLNLDETVFELAVNGKEGYISELSDKLGIEPIYNWSQRKHIQDISLPTEEDSKWSTFDQAVVYLKDIESAILNFLLNEVKVFPLEATHLVHLKSIIEMLAKYYPKTSNNLQESLWKVFLEISDATEIDKREDWVTILVNSGINVIGELDHIEYAACTPSKGVGRGYTCSLWTLFHFLTASAEDATVVAEAIKNIVVDFFGCIHCVENFNNEIKMFPLNQITDQNSGILWLWNLHNSVNKRLSGDESEDPKFPKVQWPTKEMCKTCYKSESDTYDEENIVKFILNRNKVSNLVLPENETIVYDLTEDESITENPRLHVEMAEVTDSHKNSAVYGGRIEDDEEEDVPMAIPVVQEPQSDLDLELMGVHIHKNIFIDPNTDNLEIESNGALHVKVVPDENDPTLTVETPKNDQVSQNKPTDKTVPTSGPKPAISKSDKKASWIENGIKKHEENIRNDPINKIIGRMKMQPEFGIAEYIKELHNIGYNEDEIEKMLKTVNFAEMFDDTAKLKKTVEKYLSLHENESLEKTAFHHHDEDIIPIKHRVALDSRLRRLNDMRLGMEDQFSFIGFSLLDTYFYILLWLSSIFILVWFYCGYNCRLCYTRRKPIYRFSYL